MGRELQGRTILVIEDDYWIAGSLASLLRQAGATVVGPEGVLSRAVELARECEVDAALVDVNLHGEVSYPAVDILLARKIRVIFMTGYDRSGLAANYAACTVCAKPFSRQDIIAALGQDSSLTLSPGVAGAIE